MSKIYYYLFNTDLCEILLVKNKEDLTQLCIKTEPVEWDIKTNWLYKKSAFTKEETQLNEYLLGKRKSFEISIDLAGSDFQKKVWTTLEAIPYGELRSYKEIAEQIGKPKAYRAVGMACNKNPIPLIIPCHRVVSASKKLSGFAYGTNLKKQLLELEGVKDLK